MQFKEKFRVRLVQIKKGFKITLVIVNLTLTTMTDATIVALVSEARSNIHKLKEYISAGN